MTELNIQGTTAEDFESIRQLFEQNMHRYLEDNAQLCVYVDDHCEVDLWASPAADTTFNGDALINVFSSGKSLESIAMAWLVSEGRLLLTDRVTDYWPEYGAAGKAKQTIADVMRHEAGLAALNEALDPMDLHRDQLKQNKISEILAAHPTQYRAGGIAESRDYHALSRGWIVNEIFRRADAQGRTMGEFFETEVPMQTCILVLRVLTSPVLQSCSLSLLASTYGTAYGLLPRAEKPTTTSRNYLAVYLISPFAP